MEVLVLGCQVINPILEDNVALAHVRKHQGHLQPPGLAGVGLPCSCAGACRHAPSPPAARVQPPPRRALPRLRSAPVQPPARCALPARGSHAAAAAAAAGLRRSRHCPCGAWLPTSVLSSGLRRISSATCGRPGRAGGVGSGRLLGLAAGRAEAGVPAPVCGVCVVSLPPLARRPPAAHLQHGGDAAAASNHADLRLHVWLVGILWKGSLHGQRVPRLQPQGGGEAMGRFMPAPWGASCQLPCPIRWQAAPRVPHPDRTHLQVAYVLAHLAILVHLDHQILRSSSPQVQAGLGSAWQSIRSPQAWTSRRPSAPCIPGRASISSPRPAAAAQRPRASQEESVPGPAACTAPQLPACGRAQPPPTPPSQLPRASPTPPSPGTVGQCDC